MINFFFIKGWGGSASRGREGRGGRQVGGKGRGGGEGVLV